MTAVVHQGLNLEALTGYLTQQGISVAGDLRAELITGGKSNLTYLVEDGSSRWVLRRPPTGGLTPSAHDVAREFKVTEALQGSGVPVAETVVLCEDDRVMGAPFTMVSHVAGRTVQTKDDLNDLDDEDVAGCVSELVRILAVLHQVDHEAVGLADFGRPQGYVARQVALWAKQWDRVKSADSSDIETLHAELSAAVPTESASSVVHGDYRLDNAILAPNSVRVAAVVDWEMATVGDPLTDVALMCVYRHPAIDLVIGEPAAWTSSRLPAPAGLAEQYAAASGRDLAHWDFYLGLANFKVAVIAAGIDHRFRAGATVGEGFDRSGEAVPEFISAGLRAMRGRA